MRLAFLISAYTDPTHLKRLVYSLPSDAHFYIHIDGNVDIAPFEQTLRIPSVHFVKKRTKVMWGSFTQVKYQIEMLQEALNASTSYDYFFVLSGLDYPVWSNQRIIHFLNENSGKNFLQAICLDGKDKKSTRLYRTYRFFNNKVWKRQTIKSKFRVFLRRILSLFLSKPLTIHADNNIYHLYKGSDYFAITRDLAQYIVKEWNCRPQLKRYFRTSFAPSETFIHTIAFNSKFADSCIRYQETDEKKSAPKYAKLTPLTYIDYKENIKILTEEDFDDIINSKKMFCRKVTTGESDYLMELIDKERNEEERR